MIQDDKALEAARIAYNEAAEKARSGYACRSGISAAIAAYRQAQDAARPEGIIGVLHDVRAWFVKADVREERGNDGPDYLNECGWSDAADVLTQVEAAIAIAPSTPLAEPQEGARADIEAWLASLPKGATRELKDAYAFYKANYQGDTSALPVEDAELVKPEDARAQSYAWRQESDIYQDQCILVEGMADTIDRLTAANAQQAGELADARKVLAEHHAWHNDSGEIALPDGNGGWVEIDFADAYSDSLMCERTMKVLAGRPADEAGPMPRGGVQAWWWAEAVKLRRQLKAAQERADKAEDLIVHCWVHTAYPNCGYNQMTTEQKAFYDGIIARAVRRDADTAQPAKEDGDD